MNAAAPEAAVLAAAAPAAAERSRRQAEVVAALGAVLPAHALLWQREDTVPYECDGLTAYRQRPLVVALPETEAQVRRVLRDLPSRSRCRWWRAAPAPACRAARMPHALGVTLSLAKFNRIVAHRSASAAPRGAVRRAQPGHQRGGRALRPVLRARSVAARSPAPSAATWPRTRAACIA